MLLVSILIIQSVVTALSWSNQINRRYVAHEFHASRLDLASNNVHDEASKSDLNGNKRHKLVFPGGGIFFYWQAGAMNYLRESGYDLSQVSMAGASAGALTATLTATGVDFYKATELALQLSEEAGVWDRPLGLQGVWGPLIYEWLDTLIPQDAVQKVADERLSLLVTPIPSFGTSRIASFNNREDLIRCNMASVHIPWFLDGKLFCNFRDSPHMDGSFLTKAQDYIDRRVDRGVGIINMDWKQDPVMEERSLEFVKLVSKDGIWSMLSQGKTFAQNVMEPRGDFASLPKI